MLMDIIVAFVDVVKSRSLQACDKMGFDHGTGCAFLGREQVLVLRFWFSRWSGMYPYPSVSDISGSLRLTSKAQSNSYIVHAAHIQDAPIVDDTSPLRNA
jgi:hypothetical protein